MYDFWITTSGTNYEVYHLAREVYRNGRPLANDVMAYPVLFQGDPAPRLVIRHDEKGMLCVTSPLVNYPRDWAIMMADDEDVRDYARLKFYAQVW